MRIAIAVLAATTIGAATLATSEADAHRARVWPRLHWDHNFYGRGGISHGGWGLGGPADAPFVGGSLIAVRPWGPYPYGPYPHGLYR